MGINFQAWLDGEPSDQDRVRVCRQMAEDCRRRYFQGEQDVLGDLERNPEFRKMSRAEREATAEKRWGNSVLAQDIMKQEALFSRWAMEYATYHTLWRQ